MKNQEKLSLVNRVFFNDIHIDFPEGSVSYLFLDNEVGIVFLQPSPGNRKNGGSLRLYDTKNGHELMGFDAKDYSDDIKVAHENSFLPQLVFSDEIYVRDLLNNEYRVDVLGRSIEKLPDDQPIVEVRRDEQECLHPLRRAERNILLKDGIPFDGLEFSILDAMTYDDGFLILVDRNFDREDPETFQNFWKLDFYGNLIWKSPAYCMGTRLFFRQEDNEYCIGHSLVGYSVVSPKTGKVITHRDR